MTVRYIRIDSPADISKAWEKAPEAWRIIESRVPGLTLRGKPKEMIFKKTPLSNVTRYRYRTTTVTHRKGEQYKNMIPGNLRRAFDIETKGKVTSIGYRASAKLPYANYQHERLDPNPQYWSPATGRGWTTPGTGNKFVQGPLEELADFIPEEMGKFADDILSERGL